MPHCPKCGAVVARQTPQQIVDRILQLPDGTRFQVLAPVVRGRKGEYEGLLEELAGQGYARARVDGELLELADRASAKLARYEMHTIEVVVDRLVRREGIERRLTDSLETALRLADGVAEVELVPKDGEGEPEILTFSQHLACPNDGTSFHELAPRNFSFNSPYGACPHCDGLGTRFEVDPELVVPNTDLTLDEGAVAPWAGAAGRVLPPGARRRGRDLRLPHHHAVQEAEEGPAEGPAVRVGHQAGPRPVPQPLRPHPLLLHPLRGGRPLPAAPPLRGGVRLHAGADRGLHAGGALPRLRRRPPQARVAGRHRRRPQHQRAVRPVDRQVGRVPGHRRAVASATP